MPFQKPDNDSRVPRVTDTQYARAESASRIVKLAREWYAKCQAMWGSGNGDFQAASIAANDASILLQNAVSDYNALLEAE